MADIVGLLLGIDQESPQKRAYVVLLAVIDVYLYKLHLSGLQITDPAEIEKIIDSVLAANPKQVEQYRGGKTKLQGFFAGQVQGQLCWQFEEFF